MSVSRRPGVVADLVVALAAIATFARGVPSPLVATWDDGRFLIEFEEVQRVSWDALVSIWTRVHFQAWHPLHLMSYWLDVPWAGPSGPVIHAVNLALWVLALVLVRRVMVALGLPIVAATFAALVYGLHPVQVEAVTWATGRKEIVALAFACASVLAHVRATGAWDRWAWLSRGAFVLAAMAKTTVLPLPVVLWLADVLLRDVKLRDATVRAVPGIAIAAAWSVLVVTIWTGHEMIRPDAGGGTSTGRVALVASTLTHYLSTAFFPSALSPVYPIDRHGEIAVTAFAGPLVIAAAIALAWKVRARRALFALLAFLALLGPVSNVVPVYFQVQDRYLSLPLFALAFGAGAALDFVLARAGAGAKKRGTTARRLALALAGALVALLAARTVQYEGAWSSDGRLWLHATATHPDAFYAWMKLGEYRRDRGDFANAIAAYRRAVDAAPDLRLGHGALFYALALRDERRYGIEPSRAAELTNRFLVAADDPEQLRAIASQMVVARYREAALFPLGRALAIAPIADDRLERAALIQLQRGNDWLARYYLQHMQSPPMAPALRALADRELDSSAL